MSELSCLTCKHAHFTAPSGWKPSYEGRLFDFMGARVWVATVNQRLPFECTLNPVWAEVSASHFCGHWQTELADAWNPRDLDQFLFGRGHARAAERAEKENRELKKQLKSVRAISASRLARLKANGKTG
jgi:hypothetical protein